MTATIACGDILEMPISEEEAGEVYRLFEAHSEQVGWWASSAVKKWKRRFAKGESNEDLARLAVHKCYFWCYRYQASSMGALLSDPLPDPPTGSPTLDLCLDVFAAVGIEPPENVPGRGHGRAWRGVS